MPRKSTASAAPTDTNEDVSMVSEAPTVSSPKQSKDQTDKQEKEKQGKRKSEGDVMSIDVSFTLPQCYASPQCAEHRAQSAQYQRHPTYTATNATSALED